MMRRVMTAALICAALAVPLIAGQADEFSSPKLRIEWTEFEKLNAANGAVIVDVRGATDYEGGHIPGAWSIPLAEVESRVAELKNLNRPIVVYCA